MNDSITSVLEEMGLAWSRREGEVVVPASARGPCEVVVTQDGDKVLVRAAMVAWDGIGEQEERAVRHLLRLAETNVRFTQLLLESNGVFAEARLSNTEIEAGLSDAVGSVLAAARALSREIALLLQPEIAKEYETFQRNRSEIVSSAVRI